MTLPTPSPARASPHAGFTLTELLVVLAILSALAALAAPAVMKHFGRMKAQTARLEMKNIATALDIFRIDVGRYPAQAEGLDALAIPPAGLKSWKGPYLEKKTKLTDPWGNSYHYQVPGQAGDYDLRSYGADGKEGGTGDAEDITHE